MGLFDVIGRATPTSVQAVRGSMRGTVRFVTLNPASITDMVTIFSTGNVLLLQTPGGYRFGNVYVACGDLLELRATTILRDSTRYWQVDVTVVDRPTGISQGLSNTYTVALATYPTYAAMAGATYFNVLAGVDPNSVGANTFVNPIYGGTVL